MTEQHTGDHTYGSDAKAAFLGLIIGAIVLFILVFTIVKLTAGKYAGEKPAATATR